MMNITYVIDGKLYLNITNKCCCDCTFCIRKNGEGAYGSEPLWLDHQPDLQEVIDALKKHNPDDYKEIIFCGYGEPTCELDILIETAKYLRSVTKTPIRINTNGLSDLINKKPTASLFKGLFDTVSISLNAPTEKEYMAVTRPAFKNAFEAMKSFAAEVNNYVPRTVLSVVDVIGEENIKKSQEVADQLGITLRVREYES